MSECLFCKIINKEIPAKIVFENDKIIAFEDIYKCTPVHILIVPKQHIESVLKLDDSNIEIVGEIFLSINIIAKKIGIDSSGFRIITNCGDDGGQTVKHLHYHLLGGQNLGTKLISCSNHN